MKPTPNISHRIYFVRHGESLGNIKKVLIPSSEDELTETGRLQATLLGKHLSKVTFSRVYSSTFPRARETTKCVVNESEKIANDLTVNYDHMLTERNYGTFEGKPYKEALKDALQQNVHPLKWEPLGGEPYHEFCSRIFTFFEKLLQTLDQSPTPETVLVVSHGSFLLTFLVELTQGGSQGARYQISGYSFDTRTELIGNTEYFVLSVEKLEHATLNNLNFRRSVHFETTKNQEHLNELMRTKPDLLPESKNQISRAEIQRDFEERLAKCV